MTLEKKSWGFSGCFRYSCFSTVRPETVGTNLQHFQWHIDDFCPSIMIYVEKYGTLRNKLLETKCFITIRNTDLLPHLHTACINTLL